MRTGVAIQTSNYDWDNVHAGPKHFVLHDEKYLFLT